MKQKTLLILAILTCVAVLFFFQIVISVPAGAFVLVGIILVTGPGIKTGIKIKNQGILTIQTSRGSKPDKRS